MVKISGMNPKSTHTDTHANPPAQNRLYVRGERMVRLVQRFRADYRTIYTIENISEKLIFTRES